MNTPQEDIKTMDLVSSIIAADCSNAQSDEVALIVDQLKADDLISSGIVAVETSLKTGLICSHAYCGFIAGIVLMVRQNRKKQTEELYKMYQGGN
jgi:hypothetical protein